MTLANAIRGRRARTKGAAAESAVADRLRALGLLQVQRIETGWRVRRVGPRIVGATPLAKVAGDFRALLPGGRSVMVECKARPDRLAYGDLDVHQVVALTYHAECGGLSLLAWAFDGGLAVMQWPVAGLVKGKGIGPQQALSARWAGVA